jgi:hypothetical protein
MAFPIDANLVIFLKFLQEHDMPAPLRSRLAKTDTCSPSSKSGGKFSTVAETGKTQKTDKSAKDKKPMVEHLVPAPKPFLAAPERKIENLALARTYLGTLQGFLSDQRRGMPRGGSQRAGISAAIVRVDLMLGQIGKARHAFKTAAKAGEPIALTWPEGLDELLTADPETLATNKKAPAEGQG